MPRFEIDDDIRAARTLPSEFYTDAQYFDLSKEKIFARTWQYAGRPEEQDELEPLWLLPGVLDTPLVRVKRNSETLCLSNVCTHRGMILVDRHCRADLIRCRYHGRRFDLDGKLLSMPEFDGVLDFPSETDNLPVIPSAEWGSFLFASLDPVAPLDDFIRDAIDRYGLRGVEGLPLADATGYEFNANWALYCENYLEGFHIPYVHPSLNDTLSYKSYTTETFRYSVLQTGFDRNGDVAGRYLFVFPNLMLNFYPWGISVNVVHPLGPMRSSVNFLTYVWDRSLRDEGAGADLHTVEMEDEAVVEKVQEGLRSPYYDRGRYSPTREQGTHHFHRLIAEFIG